MGIKGQKNASEREEWVQQGRGTQYTSKIITFFFLNRMENIIISIGEVFSDNYSCFRKAISLKSKEK